LQARITGYEETVRQHLQNQRISNERVHELERENAGLRDLLLSLSGSQSINDLTTKDCRPASPAGLGNGTSQVAQPNILPNGSTAFDPSLLGSLKHDCVEAQLQSQAPLQSGRLQTLTSHHTHPIPAEISDTGIEKVPNIAKDIHPSATSRAATRNLPDVSSHISLAQAAQIIQEVLADPTEHPLALEAYPHSEGQQSLTLPSTNGENLPPMIPEISPTVSIDAPSTFDVIRLIRDRNFDFINDLACPIFQTIVMVSTGQGHVTVAVRGEDGNALTSAELWARLHGFCGVSDIMLFRSWTTTRLTRHFANQFDDSFDLQQLCDGLRLQIADRPCQ